MSKNEGGLTCEMTQASPVATVQREEIIGELGKLVVKISQAKNEAWDDFEVAKAFDILYEAYVEICRRFKITPLTED